METPSAAEQIDRIVQRIKPRPTWQPIETAPRDGTEILVCMTHNLGDAEWETIQWVDWWMPGHEWPIYRDRIDIPFPPSRWMPLPDPPA